MRRTLLSIVLSLVLPCAAFAQSIGGGQGINGAGGVKPTATCGDSSHALAWNGSAYVCQAITGSAGAGGTPGQIQINSAGALAGVTAVPVANGGTNATAAGATAAHNIGAAAEGANSDITSLSGLTTPLSLAQGGTAAGSASAARASLGLGSIATVNSPVPVANGGTAATAAGATAAHNIGAAAEGANSDITSLSGLTTPLSLAQGGTNAITASAARTSLGLGSIATVNSPIPVANGGTNATSAGATAANNIGALAEANNLSDVASVPAAFANLAGGMAANTNLTGTDTITLASGNAKYTLTANETLTINKGSLPITPSATQLYYTQFEVCQDATGNHTLTVAAGTGITNIYWSGGAQPGYTLTAANGDWYACSFDNTNLRCRETMSNQPC